MPPPHRANPCRQGIPLPLLQRFDKDPLLLGALEDARTVLQQLTAEHGKAAVAKDELAAVAELQSGYGAGRLMQCRPLTARQ